MTVHAHCTERDPKLTAIDGEPPKSTTEAGTGLRLVQPDDLVPPHAYDLSPGSDSANKVALLAAAFGNAGFDPQEAPPVGYPLDGKVQLLDGGHRAMAASRARIRLPVVVKSREAVRAAYDTPSWDDFTHNTVPLCALTADKDGATTDLSVCCASLGIEVE